MRLSPFPAVLAYLVLLVGVKSGKSLRVVSSETQVVLAVAYLCRYCSHFMESRMFDDHLMLVRVLYILLPIVTLR